MKILTAGNVKHLYNRVTTYLNSSRQNIMRSVNSEGKDKQGLENKLTRWVK